MRHTYSGAQVTASDGHLWKPSASRRIGSPTGTQTSPKQRQEKKEKASTQTGGSDCYADDSSYARSQRFRRHPTAAHSRS